MIKTVLAVLFLTFTALANDKVDIDGHMPGKFTMDIEAATKYAAEKDLPILLNFTGSDWCGWCKLMDKNVFDKEEWAAYAKDNVVMVYVDFPKDKSLVPEKYVSRNVELRTKFGVRGYPTYMIIDAESNVIGKLGAGRDKTPASFKSELESVAAMKESSVKAFAEKLGGEQGAEYLAMYKKIQENEAGLKKAKEEYDETVKALSTETKDLKSSMEEARAMSRLSTEQIEDYKKLRTELKDAEAALKKFIASNPPQGEETMKTFQELGAKLKEIKEKLAAY